MGLPHRGYSVGTAGELDGDRQAVMSPEHAMRLWGRGAPVGKTPGRNSCLSSRSNSALTLTDTEHENKSDSDNGKALSRGHSLYIPLYTHTDSMSHSRPPAHVRRHQLTRTSSSLALCIGSLLLNLWFPQAESPGCVSRLPFDSGHNA